MNGEQKHFSNAGERALWNCAERRLIGPLLGLVFVCLTQVAVSAAQQPFGQEQPYGQAPQRIQQADDGLIGLDPTLAKRQIKMLNVQRQKKMVSDADKLLKLAAQLKEEVDAGGDSAQLSPQRVREVEEIEKLAKSVKEKMTLTVGEGPLLAPIVP